MRPDGTLECFDEIWYASQDPAFQLKAEATGDRLRAGNVSLTGFYDMIQEALIIFQSFFLRVEERPWTICFPFARPDSIAEGKEIRNLTKDVTYKVENVVTNDAAAPSGIVTLTGRTPPERGDRLRLPDDVLVRFTTAFPRSNAQSFQFDESHNLKEDTGSWFDTITYLLLRREPASTDKRPFGGAKEAKRRFRSTFVDPFDEGFTVQVFGQRFDNIIQFDAWAKTMSGARDLIDWFTEFMDLFTWVFKWNGVQELLYWQQNVDELATRWRNDIVNQTLQYYVRTESVTSETLRRMNSVLIELSLLPATPTGVVEIPLPTGDVLVTVAETRSGTGVLST